MGGGTTTNKRYNENIAKLIELYGDYMYHVAFRILKNEEDAKDAVQEILTKLCVNGRAPDVDSEYAVAKLTVAVKNMAYDYYDKIVRRRHLPNDEEIIEAEVQTYIDPCNPESLVESIALTQCIDKLSVKQKEYILLRYHMDKSVKEIAEIKKKSEKSVYAELERAIKKLRRLMNE